MDLDKLEKLVRLRDAGLLTQDEFEEQKAKALDLNPVLADVVAPAVDAKPYVKDFVSEDEEQPRSRLPWIISGLVLALLAGFLAWSFLSNGNGEVQVVVTTPANARDRPTTEGSQIVARFDPGTKLEGSWVQGISSQKTRWLKLVSSNQTLYIWSGNLSDEGLPVPPVAKACVGVFTQVAYPVEDNGDTKQRCFPSIDGNRSVCTDPAQLGALIHPSQIWRNIDSNASTVCEHGGYCYPLAAIKLNAACAHDSNIGRYRIDKSGADLGNEPPNAPPLTATNISPKCSGFYSFIPINIEKDVAFSVEIQPTAIEVLYTDYGKVFVRKSVRSDGSIRFNDERGGAFSNLRCDGESATLDVDADEYNIARTYRLVKTKSDIWSVAKSRGWVLGD